MRLHFILQANLILFCRIWLRRWTFLRRWAQWASVAMPIPFGFGVGDFIAIASLANGIIKSLSEARGSAAQYASLIELLRGLSDSISTITTFLGSSSTGAPLRIDDAFRNGICFHMECCRRLMSKFLVWRCINCSNQHILTCLSLAGIENLYGYFIQRSGQQGKDCLKKKLPGPCIERKTQPS